MSDPPAFCAPGSFGLNRSATNGDHADVWASSISACLDRCRRCRRCHYISVSLQACLPIASPFPIRCHPTPPHVSPTHLAHPTPQHSDCSWYARCDLQQKPVGFISAPAPGITSKPSVPDLPSPLGCTDVWTRRVSRGAACWLRSLLAYSERKSSSRSVAMPSSRGTHATLSIEIP